MKIFLHFLLTILMVTAAPYVLSASDDCKLQRWILKEIIDSVISINLLTEIHVKNVITPEHCTHENFCKAGEVLSAYKTEVHRLKEKDWRLPRQLVAYTRNMNCKVNSSLADQVHLDQLLQNIKRCAQMHYRKRCD